MNVSVSKLRGHPTQMRTVTGVMALAQLALQMRDPDPNLPLLVLPAEDRFVVVSGHRRWLAAMIAHLTEEPTVEAMLATVEKTCHPKDGLVPLDEALYKEILALLPADFDLPAAEWSDEKGKDVLGLLRANMGAEEPDLLGQSFCLTQAVANGYTIEELAQAAGMPVAKAQAILNISFLPATYQEMIQNGWLFLDVVPKLMGLDKNARDGIRRALKNHYEDLNANERRQANYTSQVSLAITFMTSSIEVFDRKDVDPMEVNRRWVLWALCERAKKTAGAAYYEALADWFLQRAASIGSIDPYRDALASMREFQDYFTAEWRVVLNDQALEVMEDASCDNCQFAGLPQDAYLKQEPDIPCRKKKRLPDDHRCWWWAPQDQPFWMRLPYLWQNGGKTVNQFDVFLKTWQGQHKCEEQKRADSSGMAGGSLGEDAGAMDVQRAEIRFFMERHVQPPFTTVHPWATTCALCKYHLQASPVKSAPDAPHCRWARGRQRIRFEARVPETGEAEEELPWIPFCYQYTPQESWTSLIPHADGDSPFPRDIMIEMISELANSANSRVYDVTSRGVLQFLTGRPEGKETHNRTFQTWFASQVDGLADRQVYTLLRWIELDWLRAKSHLTVTIIPYDGLFVACAHLGFAEVLLEDRAEAQMEDAGEEN